MRQEVRSKKKEVKRRQEEIELKRKDKITYEEESEVRDRKVRDTRGKGLKYIEISVVIK